jgi:ankyrin repeat protein
MKRAGSDPDTSLKPRAKSAFAPVGANSFKPSSKPVAPIIEARSQDQAAMRFLPPSPSCDRDSASVRPSVSVVQTMPVQALRMANEAVNPRQTRPHYQDAELLPHAATRDTELVGDYIRQWPDLLVSAKNINGMNALAVAAKFGHKDVVELLLALPNAAKQAGAVDQQGANALMFAAYKGDKEIAQLLLALPNAQQQARAVDRRGANALMFANKKGHKEVEETLIHASDSAAASAVGADKQ